MEPTDYFFGDIGKGAFWGLLCETSIVVFVAEKKEFKALRSLEEAKQYVDTANKVYVWNAGIWQEVIFMVSLDRPAQAPGFSQPNKSDNQIGTLPP
jgi:hypothetical protein